MKRWRAIVLDWLEWAGQDWLAWPLWVRIGLFAMAVAMGIWMPRQAATEAASCRHCA